MAWSHSLASAYEILPWRLWIICPRRLLNYLCPNDASVNVFLLCINLCWQVWSWTPVEVFPSWRSADEHKLASECSGICECNTTQYRSWGKQNITQTPLPEGRVPTGSKHHPDYCFSMLLCKYTVLILLMISDGYYYINFIHDILVPNYIYFSSICMFIIIHLRDDFHGTDYFCKARYGVVCKVFRIKRVCVCSACLQ
jgi:hypothetical protein